MYKHERGFSGSTTMKLTRVDAAYGKYTGMRCHEINFLTSDISMMQGSRTTTWCITLKKLMAHLYMQDL